MDAFEVESVCWDDVSADDFDVAGGKASQSGENMASVSGRSPIGIRLVNSLFPSSIGSDRR